MSGFRADQGTGATAVALLRSTGEPGKASPIRGGGRSAKRIRRRDLFHRDAVKQITKLKDGDGQYIWRQSVREGEPDTLLGLPMTISEWAPNTFTTGLYVGLLGDFQHYWIVDALAMQVQRLNELYAETNQVGFIGAWRPTARRCSKKPSFASSSPEETAP